MRRKSRKGLRVDRAMAVIAMAGLTMGGFFAPTASANVVLEDDFEGYELPTPLSGLNGGFGWNNAWTGNGAASAQIVQTHPAGSELTPKHLAVTFSDGRIYSGADQALHLPPNNHLTYASRNFSHSHFTGIPLLTPDTTDRSFYVSFLLHIDEEATIDTDDVWSFTHGSGIALLDVLLQDMPAVGIVGDSFFITTYGGPLGLLGGNRALVAPSIAQPEPGGTYLIVARYDWSPAVLLGGRYGTGAVWVRSDGGEVPESGLPDAVTDVSLLGTLLTSVLPMNRFVIQTQGLDNGPGNTDSIYVDGFRLGTTFEAVVPQDQIVVPSLVGDINGDGLLTVADVTELGNLLASETPPAADVGDINLDGEVNEDDLQPLAQLIADQ
jgi:hypothetical protein